MPFPCPYCSLPLSADGPGRVVCPRCGESVPVPARTGAAAPAVTDDEPEPDGTVKSMRSLALIGAAVALAVGSFGVYAFTRPAPDRRPVTPPSVAPAAAPSPLAWPGVAELPADCAAVFAARPALAPDARAKLRAAGLPDAAFTTLDQLGVPFERLDAVAAGVVASPALVPRTVVVVHERGAVDFAALRAKVQAKPAAQFGALEFTARGVPVFVRANGPRSLVFATELADLKPTPPRTPVPADPAGQLPAAVRDAARNVPASAVAWAATGLADWPAVPAVGIGLKLLDDKARPAADRLARAAAVWASVPPDGSAEVWTRDAGGKWNREARE